MTNIEAPTCPACKSKMVPAVPAAAGAPPSFQCRECDQPDPLKSDQAARWLQGLRPPK